MGACVVGIQRPREDFESLKFPEVKIVNMFHLGKMSYRVSMNLIVLVKVFRTTKKRSQLVQHLTFVRM